MQILLQEKQINSKHRLFFVIPCWKCKQSISGSNQVYSDWLQLMDQLKWGSDSETFLTTGELWFPDVGLGEGRERKKERTICVPALYTFLILLYTLLCEEAQINTMLFSFQKRGLFPNVLPRMEFTLLPQLLVRLRCHVSSEGVALWLDLDEPQSCPVISYSRCVSAM